MVLVFLRISIDELVNWARDIARRRKVKLEVTKPQLARPDLIATYFIDETLDDGIEAAEDPDSLPFQFSLNFGLKNPSNQSVGDCEYTVVAEHDSAGPENMRATTNFEGEILEYNGLSEPQVAPVLIQTDLDSKVILKSTETGDETKTHRLSLNSTINLRIKAIAADTLAAGQKDITLHRLLRDWVDQCEGMDMRRFADDPTIIEPDLSELPSMVVGKDVGSNLRRFR